MVATNGDLRPAAIRRYRPPDMRRAILAAAVAGVLALGSLGALLAGRWPDGSAEIAAGASPRPSTSAAASPSAAPSPSATARPAPSPSLRPAATAEIRARLARRLDSLRVEDAIPGVSAAIIFPGGEAWVGASGLADVRAKRAVTPKTAFAIASISKTFLAALILELAAEGKLSLADPASRYLPDRDGLDGITIRMLLDHTSGLHDFFLHPKIDRALRSEPARGWSPTRTLGYVGKPYFAPGTGWHYSNTNYLLLGLIAEQVGGRPLATQLRARFFEPLGLTSTYYQAADRPRGPTAHGYRFAGVGKRRPPIDLADGTGIMPFKSVVTAAGGAGSVAASAIDVARWARALYRGEVLDRAGLALMTTELEPVPGYRAGVPYGIGVQMLTVDGHRTLGHSGRLLGFRSIVRYLPDMDLTIAVLTNQSRVDAGVVARELLRVVVPLAEPCRLCPVES